MNAKTILIRTTGMLLAFVMLAASGGLAWAAAGDYSSKDLVPVGVTVAGVELGGLSPAEVRETVERTVVEPLLAPVTVRAASAVFEIEPAEFLHADVEQAVSDAFEPNRDSTIAERTYRRLLEEPVSVEVAPEIVVDREALSKRVAGMAVGVDLAAVDATVGIESGSVVMGPSSEGRSLDQTASVEIIAKALLSGDTEVDLPVNAVAPEVAEQDLGKWIVVRGPRARSSSGRTPRSTAPTGWLSAPRATRHRAASGASRSSATCPRGVTREASGRPTCPRPYRRGRATPSAHGRST
jgi:hypothetical protein